MTYKKIILGLLILAVFIAAEKMSFAQVKRDMDKTLAPYFLVKSRDHDLDRLPLKSTRAEVKISGVIADVKVSQVYKNEGKKPLEAIYVFPASTRAAVYDMKMTVGERTITAKVREREQARKEYDQAKQAGKSVSLLEQQKPNVFQMNVANILPSDIIRVELKYTELLVPTEAIYEFVYPTVVGPRYVDQAPDKTAPSSRWTANPYLHQGQPPTYSFNISVDISAGLPIQDISCASHKTKIDYKGPDFARVELDSSEKHGGNRDFIMKYRLAGDKIKTGLLLFEGKKGNFFLLMLQPPQRITKDEIPPREYIFIVDVSGSMHGFPLDISKKLLRDLIGNLDPADRFNVLLFAGGSHMISKRSLPATRENVQHAINAIEQQRGGGGTRLLPALKRALSLPKIEGYSRTIVIATDGYVSVEEEAFDLIRDNLGNANIFAFGIGSSVNRHLIEGMARVGMGEPFIITRPEEAHTKSNKFMKLIENPVLTGIKLDFGQFDVYDVEPHAIPDVLADRPVIVFGKWRGKPNGSISLQGLTGEHSFMKRVDVSRIRPLKINSALRYLWARHRIGLLSDYNRLKLRDERVREVTNLGLSYNLLTAYTSFIAVDTRIRLQDGKAVTVKQALPLPYGVTDYAVGGNSTARKSLTSLAPSTLLKSFRSKVMGKELEEKKEVNLTHEPKSDISVKKENLIELGKISVTGGLAKKAVRKVLEKHVRTFDLCYRKTLEKQPDLKGKIVMKIVIDSAGRVIKIHKGNGEKKEREFEKCIAQKLVNLSFPQPKNRKEVVVTITFILK